VFFSFPFDVQLWVLPGEWSFSQKIYTHLVNGTHVIFWRQFSYFSFLLLHWQRKENQRKHHGIFIFSKLLNVGSLSFSLSILLADFLFLFSYSTASIPQAPSCNFSANLSIPFSLLPRPTDPTFPRTRNCCADIFTITQFVCGKNLWLNFIHVHVRLL